jgi:nucleoside-diphosphate-sugar epimerase
VSRVAVIGGAGYKGCVLVPKLLAQGHEVVVFDLLLFGTEGLPEGDDRLEIIEGDIRDVDAYRAAIDGADAVINLACISNDPSFELDPSLSRKINYEAFEPMVKATVEAGVPLYIYASTSSVYGVSDAPEVTEDHPLVPVSDYNRFKGMTEPLLLKYQSDSFTPVIIRPATVCGYSPRTRLDLTVNILTNHAVNKGRITVFGGAQKRPNVHIEDITDLYVDLLDRWPAELISGQTFNAGYENFTVRELADQVKSVVEDEFPELVPIDIVTTPSDDMRSYHVSSKKILDILGWAPRRSIEDAVRDLCVAFREGRLPDSFDDDKYFNVRTTKQLVPQ